LFPNFNLARLTGSFLDRSEFNYFVPRISRINNRANVILGIRLNSIQLQGEVEVGVRADALGVQVYVFERLTATRIEIEGEWRARSKNIKFDQRNRNL
jgi:hypothetical protein